jgi:non-ribosomal peptide synthetase component F
VIDWTSRRLAPSAPRLVPERFALQTRRAPHGVAVVERHRSWTYGEIDEASNRLARCLQQRGVGPEHMVGVCLERSGELLIVLLAIWKAGGAYVPLDPGHAGAADERVRFIFEDAQLTLVVTDEAHRGFDVFTGDLVRAFCSGGRLVLCSKETMLEPAALLDLMRREQIDAAEFVPVVLRNLIQHLAATTEKLDFLRLVAVGSDAWYVEDHQRALEVLGPQTRLVNSYGLTETTIDSTFFEGDVQTLPPTGIVPLGRPFPNVQLYVLDPWLRAVFPCGLWPSRHLHRHHLPRHQKVQRRERLGIACSKPGLADEHFVAKLAIIGVVVKHAE